MKFTIVSAGRNCARFLDGWYSSIKAQTCSSWVCNVRVDPSDDETVEKLNIIVEGDHRFNIVANTTQQWLLKNTYDCISLENDPDSVIVCLDLDDAFYHHNVLERIRKEYQDYGCWLTYGTFIINGDRPGFHFCKQIPDHVWSENSHRKNEWSTSALRTFKKWLWDKIDPQDFLMPDGSWIKRATDRAFMYPLLEMAGKNRVRFISEILYLYNVYGQQQPTNDIEQEALQHILSKRPYRPIEGR